MATIYTNEQLYDKNFVLHDNQVQSCVYWTRNTKYPKKLIEKIMQKNFFASYNYFLNMVIRQLKRWEQDWEKDSDQDLQEDKSYVKQRLNRIKWQKQNCCGVYDEFQCLLWHMYKLDYSGDVVFTDWATEVYALYNDYNIQRFRAKKAAEKWKSHGQKKTIDDR